LDVLDVKVLKCVVDAAMVSGGNYKGLT